MLINLGSNQRCLEVFVFNFSGDELYYIGTKANVRRKVVTSKDEILEILRCHHSDAGAHSGINSTLSKVSSSYTWSRMKQDVVDFVSRIITN